MFSLPSIGRISIDKIFSIQNFVDFINLDLLFELNQIKIDILEFQLREYSKNILCLVTQSG
jgi:hypothetical protein